MKELEILFPQRDVALGDNLIKVRELAWREALQFLGEVGKHASVFIRPDGSFAVTAEAVTGLIASSDELTVRLIRDTTDLPAEQIGKLPVSAMLELLDTALEMNLSDDILSRGKKFSAHFARLGVKAQSGAKS